MIDAPVDAYERTSEYYRRAVEGHVYIRETLDALFEAVRRRVERLGPRPWILELGAHAGVITERLLRSWPDANIVVAEDDERLAEFSRRRLRGRRVEYHSGPLETLTQPIDLAISVARHHHLPHDYLLGLRAVVRPGGVYVLADEFCPEYCEGDHAERIACAEVIQVAGGYLLTTCSEVEEHRRSGAIPALARELEGARRVALWRWYRFVVDHAIDGGYFDIAAGELQSASDDLVTGSAAEHKFSPKIVERQLELAGFQLLAKRLIGPTDVPERQSMFVYEFSLGSAR